MSRALIVQLQFSRHRANRTRKPGYPVHDVAHSEKDNEQYQHGYRRRVGIAIE